MAAAVSSGSAGSIDVGLRGEVARWIALLLSPVSSFMTGAVIPLDGP